MSRYEFPGLPLIPAVFVDRPNRFIAIVKRADVAESEKAHVADPGRLKELLIPGAHIWLRDHQEPGIPMKRKLRYTLELVAPPTGSLVSVNTLLPNRIIGELLRNRTLPGFEQFQLLRREVTIGESRIDFLLQNTLEPDENPTLLEVKSVTLVENQNGNKLALFPDAPSVRGTRHIRELMAARQSGKYHSEILLVIQRGDATAFSPNFRTDPALAKALAEAILEGVRVRAYVFDLTPQYCQFVREVPVVLPQTF